jgi:hypothetical protein
MMVLIETDKWLADLEDTLNKKDAAGRSKLEDTVLDLAHRVRNDYLRYTNSQARAGFPPTQTTKIDNKIGDGLSQYAFAGAIGPDIPSAGNIMALNQRWVGATMHKGSQRRAWQNASTTKLILDRPKNLYGYLQNISNEIRTEADKLYLSLRVGHMASIATHVIVQPFIQKWAWDNTTEVNKYLPWPFRDQNKGDTIRFGVQIDAKLAQGYFQYKSLHDGGGTWKSYLPDDNTAIDFICNVYLEGFTATYGSDPKEPVCTVPSEAQLEKDFPELPTFLAEAPFDKKYRDMFKDKLTHWGGWPPGFIGYDDLFTDKDFTNTDPNTQSQTVDYDTKKKFNDAVANIKGLQGKLTDYPCSAPNADYKFFLDAYKNTRNWALGSGYAHAPVVISSIMSAVILFTSANPIDAPDSAPKAAQIILNIIGFGVTVNVWNNTASFGSDNADELEVQTENRQAWIDKGLGQETIWFDMFDQAYGAQGIPLFFYNKTFTGIGPWDGIFGQNADALNGKPKLYWRNLYVLYNDIVSPLFLFPILLQKILVKYYRKPPFRWIFYWTVNVGFDALEALYITKTDSSIGLQGDEMGLRIWYLRVWTTGAFILGSALAFGVKAGESRANPEDNPHGWPFSHDPTWKEYLLGLVFPIVLIGTIVWWKQGFEGAMLQAITGIDWPSNDTDLIDDLLHVDQKDNVNSLQSGTGTPLPVALFDDSKLQSGDDKDADGNPLKYFPEADPATDWGKRADADEQARKAAHKPSEKTYQLKLLFDRAAIFSGLLSMSLVNYDQVIGNFYGTDQEKQAKQKEVGTIFKDWNLCYRTQNEWNDLMETADGKPGLLPAAGQWLADLKASKTSDPAVLDRLKEVFGLQGSAN